MKKVFGCAVFLLVLAFAASLFAQIPPTGQRQGVQRGPSYNLLDKDSTAKYLALTAAQKPKVNALIDSLIKVYKPYIDETNALNKKYGLPEQTLTGGGGMGMLGARGGGGIQLDETQIAKLTEERTAIQTKYLPKQALLDKFIGDIEKLMTTEDQKTKFADTRTLRRPTFTSGRRGGN
jgi:hypothetical protein